MKRYALVSGTVFSLIALVQLIRALSQWRAEVGGWPVPVWLSWVAFGVAAALAVWAFRAAKK